MSTHPTAGGTNRKRSAPLWSDLPDDILGKVLSRIVSPRDRVRFTAVCTPWRSAASRQPPPPAAPLLLLSSCGRNRMEHLCGPDDSWLLRAPSKAENKRFVGSHDGGWVALLDMDSYKLSISNLFSGAEVALSKEQSNMASVSVFSSKPEVSKIVFSDDPASPNGCILAAIVEGQLYITLCRAGCHDGRWTMCHWAEDSVDIAFCNGELYGLARPSEELYKFGIGMKGDGMPFVTASQQVSIQRRSELTWNVGAEGYLCYIFELDGKMSMAVRIRWLPSLAPFFKVFHLVDDDAHETYYKHKWAEVTSLGDYALFIGPTRCTAVHVPVSSTEYHGLERNHIYYIKHTCSWISKLPEDVMHSVTSDNGDNIKMYRLKDQSYGDGMERIGYYVQGCNYAMWVHLPNL